MKNVIEDIKSEIDSCKEDLSEFPKSVSAKLGIEDRLASLAEELEVLADLEEGL